MTKIKVVKSLGNTNVGSTIEKGITIANNCEKYKTETWDIPVKPIEQKKLLHYIVDNYALSIKGDISATVLMDRAILKYKNLYSIIGDYLENKANKTGNKELPSKIGFTLYSSIKQSVSY